MRLVTVITDTRNERADYYVSPEVAQRLYEEGTIEMVHAYNDCWTYFDPCKRGRSHAILPRPNRDAIYRGITAL